MRPDYGFRPVARSDYPLLRRWLAEPHVRAWWGDPEEEIALIEADMDSGPTDMRIVTVDGAPFAYVQDYPAHHWPMPQYEAFASGARAVDTFLGEPAFAGKGHAAAYLRARAGVLRDRFPAVLVDPDPDNARAIRAYTSAGFQPRFTAPCEDGDPVLVMEYDP
ncbi:GNAT family N-acetyltransferase [Anianabacter salinae]|uniref:GNAT family N-acetyltransferase n=1 Tax=Anianabacter salinae TaxID=2851023 RepID=UPI00225E1A95|nr:GNAT family N-acetyltransferase [Anianabacter salinae]MBV0912657.1 acetyltransferase [Anianabacter salinae]